MPTSFAHLPFRHFSFLLHAELVPQILCMSFLTIIFSAMGFLSPANRGALLMAELLLYVMMGGVAGYVTARMYKTFKGKSWQGQPPVPHLVSRESRSPFSLSWILWPWHKVVPMLFLSLLWWSSWFSGLVCDSLVFFGAYFGYKQDAMEFPVNTSSIPRQIPDQP
jgi:transmembrane 9 superfamily protein 2/4